MNCCDSTPAVRRPTRSAIGTLVSALAMVVMPKCPLCIAAYLSLVGVSIGAGTAAILLRAAQITSVTALIAAIAGLALWLARRFDLKRDRAPAR